jgi:putative AdoMet-dependent methyltransferase
MFQPPLGGWNAICASLAYRECTPRRQGGGSKHRHARHIKYNPSIQPTDMFPASDFDHWADTYDHDVVAEDVFPFAGYDRVLDAAVQMADAGQGMTVLDLGVGTGNLAMRFSSLGCKLWGTDFSQPMLDKAREKLPNARLILHDLRDAWPPELDRRFDCIVSAYVFHHFELADKVSLARKLAAQHLKPHRPLVIADISFPDEVSMRGFARSVGDLWEDELYWLADEATAALRREHLKTEYQQVSACAGVYRIEAV